ncbi:MAG TPA: ATP-binding cassette domain-containing protein [Gemmatimonadales bacterium]|nr:ATP-binding cassette domain-containing protein [Gemmatimonadales bacterium]
MSQLPALELTGITKRFGSVLALDGADFVLAAGEIHALLGENGAGKSTLLHVAFGMLAPDLGVIRVHGQAVALRSPRDARALGIGMVHQHFTSINGLTVAENIALAVGRKRRGPGQPHEMTGELVQGLDPRSCVELLSVGQRQRLEVAKALVTGARILLLDEPSAVLAPSEADELHVLLRKFAGRGGAVALITQKLPEVFAAADRVTVLQHGSVSLSGRVPPQSAASAASLAGAMIGGTPARRQHEAEEPPKGEPVASLSVSSTTPLVRIGDISIYSGELIGIAAVEGNGQRELLRRVAGVREAGATSVKVAVAVAVSVAGPVAFVPEDRTSEGLIPAMSLTENVVLGLSGDPRWSHGPRLDWAAARAHTAWLIWTFGIRAPGPDVAAATLSGGNQQKVILARALESGPRILLAENPTRGLDIRATAAVHERLRGAAQAGVAVLVYSADLDEVLELAQRVLVVRQGKVIEAPRGADRNSVGQLMVGLQTA